MGPESESSFLRWRDESIRSRSDSLRQSSLRWLEEVAPSAYTYGFSWLGRPVIQIPQDMLAIASLVWRTQPERVVETGVARGGLSVFLASLLELNERCGGSSTARVIGVERDLSDENRALLRAHPLAKRLVVVDGSSTNHSTFDRVRREVDRRRCLVVLDSDHTHEHVLEELRLYSSLVSVKSYCVVLDTVIEYVNLDYPGRSWSRGNSPATAVRQFISEDTRFEVDDFIDRQILISVAPGGYLRRVR
jgi:cephalosporin hydroxylase